jgi:cyclic beta-1,2-glucan synthetase
MYQAGLEWILGFRLRGTTLVVDPCIPNRWPGYHIDFRYHSSTYEIAVENPHRVSRGVASAELDGRLLSDAGHTIPVADDGARHRVRIVLGDTP